MIINSLDYIRQRFVEIEAFCNELLSQRDAALEASFHLAKKLSETKEQDDQTNKQGELISGLTAQVEELELAIESEIAENTRLREREAYLLTTIQTLQNHPETQR